MWRRNHVVMDQATDGTQGGPAQGVDPGNAPGAEAGAAVANGGTSAGSILASAAGATSPAASNSGAGEWFPEKHRVTKEDGTLDLEASSRKVAEAYSALEKRLGTGAPPKTPEEYELSGLPEAVKIEDLKADPETAGFLKGAHAKGMTNEQVSWVLNEYLTRAPQLMQANSEIAREEAEAELQKSWSTPDAYQQNIGAAFRAFQAYADPADVANIDAIGNNPIVVRLLANIGKEIAEDKPVGGTLPAGIDFEVRTKEILNELQALPQHDPRRQKLRQEYDDLFARKYGNKAHRLGGGATFSTAR